MSELKFKDDERLILKIGTINFSSSLGKCLISVHSSEDNIAHFHISNDNNDIKICIFKNAYFGENNYHLNDNELKELQSFLSNSENNMPELHEHSDDSIWTHIKKMWAFENNYYSDYPEKDIVSKLKQPNYNKLEDL